jgi:hypothetical protein
MTIEGFSKIIGRQNQIELHYDYKQPDGKHKI